MVCCGGGLWVSRLVFNPLPPPCGVVVGVGFRVSGLHPRHPCGAVVGFGLFEPPLLPPCGVVCCGGGLWVSRL